MPDNSRRHSDKIVYVPKSFHINIYMVVLLFIFIYMGYHFYESLTKEHISIYEVTEKQIADDNTINGLILRQETVVNSVNSGYINYYVSEGDKIGKNTTVYSIDETGNISDALDEYDSSSKLSSDDIASVRSSIAQYTKSYSPSNYKEVYDFKFDIENTVLELTNTKLASSLTSVLDSVDGTTNFSIVSAEATGIISYSVDGFEDMTMDEVSADLFENPTVNRRQLRTSQPVAKDTPVYKVVTGDDWSIVVPLTEEQYKKIKDSETLPIRFKKDNIKTTVNVDTFKKSKQFYAVLSLNRYMVQFLSDRYVEIELLLNTAEGLKIPVSSIVEKDFYLIPKECITDGDRSGEKNVTLRTYNEDGSVKNTIISTSIYYEDPDSGMCYVDTNTFSAGDLVELPDKGEVYTIKEVASLEGVYNVNKGYCEFRRIEKIYSNTEYCIISKDTDYGLSIYDHIVNNPDCINENDIIY